jgi:hypothetical protein
MTALVCFELYRNLECFLARGLFYKLRILVPCLKSHNWCSFELDISTLVCKLVTSQWTETHPHKVITRVQISGHPVAHGNQNVTWATWKRKKIAQQLCIPNLTENSIGLLIAVSIFYLPLYRKTLNHKLNRINNRLDYDMSNHILKNFQNVTTGINLVTQSVTFNTLLTLLSVYYVNLNC